MYNFLDPKLSPKVLCKSPSTDSYEIENLVSENNNNKMRGFIAYSSIKPPVEIEFHFICPVNMFYLVLNTTVGRQKCTGIEIFAKTPTIAYTSIAKSFYDKNGVIFCNSRRYSKSNPPERFIASEYDLGFFKSHTFRMFLNATSIKVLIFRTEKSVPCMSSVEVWGAPSKYCNSTTVQTIKRIMNKTEEPNSISTNSEAKNSKEEFRIPDDFKDDLTYEIMAIPMTLPSGKTVDRSTLDKHIENEKSFGRKAGDPFTGLKFSDSIKAVLNVALKSRIDMFMLQHSQRPETFNVKRCLGGQRLDSYTKHKKAKLKESDGDDDDDLECAIKKATQQPNFLCFTNDVEDEAEMCAICKKDCGHYYVTPCGHLYCRPCIDLVCKLLICSKCEKAFLKSEIKKFNK